MNIKQTFLDLTTHTVPYLKEYDYLKDVFPFDKMKKDPAGNYYIKIGNSNTMFASHLDTVGGDKEINHVIEGKMIKTDGKSVLGADDKAGTVVMLYMIEAGVPGLYQFFLGEEVGCKGSKALVAWIDKNKDGNNKIYNEVYKNINKVVSFDRKDVDSVITYQMSERCASDDFADSLIKELGNQGLKYRKDTGGVLTDSVHFTDLYAECTNLSVGYWSQHTNSERQDIEFLEKLAVACTKVDWDNLTIKRKPGETERLYSTSYNSRGGRSHYDYGGYYGNDYEWEEEYGYGLMGNTWNSTSRRTSDSSSMTNSEYVKDWKGEQIKASDAVWCEFDKVHCLKDEAIWVDLVGFYTTPDESTVKKSPKTNPTGETGNNVDVDYNKSNGQIIKKGDTLRPKDIIIHKQFGKGKVNSVSPDGRKVTIHFEKDNTTKQVLLGVASIKKIN